MSTKTLALRRMALKPLGVFALLVTFVVPVISQPVTKPVADGVTLISDVQTDPKAPMAYTALKIDLSRPGVRVESALGGDTVIEDNSTKGRESVSAFVKRKAVFAGINADFFPFTGDPFGMAIINGEFVSEPFDSRAVFGLRPDGKAVFDRLAFAGEVVSASGTKYKLHGINRARGKDEMVLFAPVFGSNTGTTLAGIEIVLSDVQGPMTLNKPFTANVQSIARDVKASPIPSGQFVLSAAGKAAQWLGANVHEGEKLTINPMVKSYMNRSWEGVQQAVAGGPWLVKDGQIYIDYADEKWEASFSTNRHPRSGVGINASGELILAVVDGRQTISQGMTLPEFAELMKSLGAVNAINLDGGGSSALSLKGFVVNSPSGGAERPVANFLSVTASDIPPAASNLKFNVEELTVQSGAVQPLCLMDADKGCNLTPEQMSKVVWGTTGGIGLVDQNGVFRPVKANKGTIVAWLGDKMIELPVTVEPGPAVKLTAKAEKDASGATNRGQVTASVIDADGNAPKDAKIAIKVTGGFADFPDGMVDKSGKIVFGITWDESIPAEKRSVVVSTQGLAPVTVKI